jgi:hypothetical protein
MTQKGIDSSRPVTEASCAHIGGKYAHEYSQRGHRNRPAFRTQWFTAYSVLSPVIGFLATVAGEKFSSRQLDASAEASGPHVYILVFGETRRS